MSTSTRVPSSSRSQGQSPSGTNTNVRSEHGERGGWKSRGRGRAIANAVFEQSTSAADGPSSQHQQEPGEWRGGDPRRGRGRGGPQSRGRGRGKEGGNNAQPAPRPTHFLALPLHTHRHLGSLVSTFQSALLAHDPPIEGLDTSIVIDPRRLHLTLGVMALEEEGSTSTSAPHPARTSGPRGPPATTSSPNPSSTRTPPTGPSTPESTEPKRTVSSALALLRSLQPQIATILAGARVKFPLEKLDVFPPAATSNANVLFLGPDETKTARRKNGNGRNNGERSEWDVLWGVSDFVHQAFKSAGYITEARPLKLHCTILNASHRKPRTPRYGFSFANILKAEEVTGLVGATNSSSYLTLPEPEQAAGPRGFAAVARAEATGVESPMQSLSMAVPGTTAAPPTSTAPTVHSNPPRPQKGSKWPKSRAVPVKVGTYDVATVELWVMGSHGPDNEYVSVGGVPLE